MQFFLTDKKLEIIIDNYKNLEKDVESGIPELLPVSAILVYINISGMFNNITISLLEVISVLFMDNLRFIVSDNIIKEVTTSLKKIQKTLKKK